MHIKAAAMIQYYVLDIFVLDKPLRHPICYETTECLSYYHYQNILLNSVEAECNKEFHVSHIQHTQAVPK